jgi:hypothetical protein
MSLTFAKCITVMTVVLTVTSGLAYMEPHDLYNPFVDHTLTIIHHNWVVLSYNFNVVILVLKIGESSIGAISAYHFIIVLFLLLPCIIILFLHLLRTNHKCTQPCYFAPATQTCYSEGKDGLEFFDEEF